MLQTVVRAGQAVPNEVRPTLCVVAVRVVIAEDQLLLREGLARLFEDCGHQVVAAAGDVEDLLTLVAEHHPDLVVVDVRMPPTFTDEGTESVRSRQPPAPCR